MARRQLTGQRFDRNHDIGGKSALVAHRRPIVETGQPIGTEPLTPFAGDLARHAELGRYAVVA